MTSIQTLSSGQWAISVQTLSGQWAISIQTLSGQSAISIQAASDDWVIANKPRMRTIFTPYLIKLKYFPLISVWKGSWRTHKGYVTIIKIDYIIYYLVEHLLLFLSVLQEIFHHPRDCSEIHHQAVIALVEAPHTRY